MMRVVAFVALAVGLLGAFQAAADIPPPYTLYGIGATMEETKALPKFTKVDAGGPAALAGLKVDDQVLALDGTYSKAPMPFYFFARGLTGRQGSIAEVIVVRNDAQVLIFKVKRTVKKG